MVRVKLSNNVVYSQKIKMELAMKIACMYRVLTKYVKGLTTYESKTVNWNNKGNYLFLSKFQFSASWFSYHIEMYLREDIALDSISTCSSLCEHFLIFILNIVKSQIYKLMSNFAQRESWHVAQTRSRYIPLNRFFCSGTAFARCPFLYISAVAGKIYNDDVIDLLLWT